MFYFYAALFCTLTGLVIIIAPIGVNLFYRLARAAAEIFAPFPMYDPFLTEAHHKMKKDAPSGTLLKLVEQMQQFPVGDHDDGPDALEMLWQMAQSIRSGRTGVRTAGSRAASASTLKGFVS